MYLYIYIYRNSSVRARKVMRHDAGRRREDNRDRESGNRVGENRVGGNSQMFLVAQPLHLHQLTPVQPVHLHVLTTTRESSHELKPQPSTHNTRACNNIPVQPVRVNLPTWFLPTWFPWPWHDRNNDDYADSCSGSGSCSGSDVDYSDS